MLSRMPKIISPTIYDRKLRSRPLPRNYLDFWVGYFPGIPYLRVCWLTQARLQVLQHAYKTPDVEVGGVLLGGVYRSDIGGREEMPVDFIEITVAIPAKSADYHAGSFNFTEEAWAVINLVRDQKFPNDQVVGWYHTHPGHTLAFGGRDRFIQNNFFSEQFHLALVIDTHSHKGVFYVDNEKLGGPFKSEEFRWDLSLMQRLFQTGLNVQVDMAVAPVAAARTEAIPPFPAASVNIPDIIISETDLPGYAQHAETAQPPRPAGVPGFTQEAEATPPPPPAGMQRRVEEATESHFSIFEIILQVCISLVIIALLAYLIVSTEWWQKLWLSLSDSVWYKVLASLVLFLVLIAIAIIVIYGLRVISSFMSKHEQSSQVRNRLR